MSSEYGSFLPSLPRWKQHGKGAGDGIFIFSGEQHRAEQHRKNKGSRYIPYCRKLWMVQISHIYHRATSCKNWTKMLKLNVYAPDSNSCNIEIEGSRWPSCHLTAFCAWGSSPHLPILMRPGIGWNASCAFTYVCMLQLDVYCMHDLYVVIVNYPLLTIHSSKSA